MSFEMLKEVMDFYCNDSFLTGCSVMVRKDHDVIFTYETGFSDLGKCSPFAGEAPVFIYSCTKMFTCVAALQLVERGKLSLEDSLSKFYPAADPRVKILNLFNMTAGYDYDLEPFAKYSGTDAGTQEIVGELVKKPLHFVPGEMWLYGLEHDILAGVVELASGMRFSDYLEENIYKPLGLKNSSMRPTKELLDKMAPQHFYDRKLGKLVPFTKTDPYILSNNYDCGGAGMISTRNDLSLFLDALACGGVGESGERILSEDSIRLYSTNTLSPKAVRTFNYQEPNMLGHGYGLGVRTFIDPSYGDDIIPIGEFGWGGAAGAEEIVDPVNHISLSFITHVLDCYGSQIMQQLMHALYVDLK